jgi:threonine synthase
MDIQVASNFERALFEAAGRAPAAVRGWMQRFKQSRRFRVDEATFAWLDVRFAAARTDEHATRACMRRLWDAGLGALDPHTAVGVDVAERLAADRPVVTLATAHPAKFPEAARAAGLPEPDLPARLADLFDREERLATLPADLDAVAGHIRRSFR